MPDFDMFPYIINNSTVEPIDPDQAPDPYGIRIRLLTFTGPGSDQPRQARMPGFDMFPYTINNSTVEPIDPDPAPDPYGIRILLLIATGSGSDQP